MARHLDATEVVTIAPERYAEWCAGASEVQVGRVILTDGYHRLCSVNSIDEDAELPCKIV